MAIRNPNLDEEIIAYDKLQTDEINKTDKNMTLMSGVLVGSAITFTLPVEFHNGVVLQAMVQNQNSSNWQSFPAVTAISMNSNRTSVFVNVEGYYANQPVFIVVAKRSFLG